MKKFLKKSAYFIGMMFLISVISFLAIHAAPNTFFAAGGLNPNMTPEAIEKLKAVYGLNQSLFMQYFSWISHLLTLNFGVSFTSGKEVIVEIKERIGITLFMNLFILIAVFIIAIALGIKAGLSRNSLLDRLIKQFSLLSFSMPSFYLSLILILFFSVLWQLFPLSGLHSIDVKEGLPYYLDFAWHLFLPLFVMLFVSLGSMILYVRSLVVEIMKSDYIYFARSRNLPQKIINRRYVLPNLLPPIVTLLGLSLPGLIGGSVILEQIFAIDGMGRLFFNAALSRDYPVILGILMITSMLTLLGNMFADLILVKLNPFFKRVNA